MWIRITDPDPKLLSTDRFWIRIHNTEPDRSCLREFYRLMYTGLASTPGRPEICEVEGQRVLTPLGRWQVLQGLAKPEVRYHTVDTHSPLFLVCPRANLEKIHPSYSLARQFFYCCVQVRGGSWSEAYLPRWGRLAGQAALRCQQMVQLPLHQVPVQ